MQSSMSPKKKKRRISRRLAYLQNGYSSSSSFSSVEVAATDQTNYLLKQLQSGGVGGRLNEEPIQKIKSDPWHLEDLDDKYKVIHDMDYQYFSEDDLDDIEIMMLSDPNVDDNVPDRYMHDHVLVPWSALKKTVEDCLVCKECSASNECNNTELKLTKNDIVAASKINISCIEKKKTTKFSRYVTPIKSIQTWFITIMD